MKRLSIPGINLRLFDGEGAGGGSAAPAAGGEGTSAASQNTQASGKPAKTKVVYGKQTNPDEPTGAETGSAQQKTEDTPTMEEFEELIKGKYKDLFAQKTQVIINDRFKNEKSFEKSAKESQALINEMMARYGVDDANKLRAAMDNDASYWEKVAEEQGLTVEQAKQMRKMEVENRQLQAQIESQKRAQASQQVYNSWLAEAETLKGDIPDFNLAAECQNKEFTDLLSRGVQMKTAYQVIHLNDITANATKEGEKKVANTVRANQNRPPENGSGAPQSGITFKSDVSKLTREDRREIARRVARGEKIEF